MGRQFGRAIEAVRADARDARHWRNGNARLLAGNSRGHGLAPIEDKPPAGFSCRRSRPGLPTLFLAPYAVAATVAERRASRFTTPPTTPTARAAVLNPGVQVWSIPSAASSANGP